MINPCDRAERRSDGRYAIDAGLTYRVYYGKEMIQAGHGAACNLSKGGLLFEAQQEVPPGLEVEVCIPWPSRYGIAAMELWASGCAVRSEGSRCAVRLVHSEFRRARQSA